MKAATFNLSMPRELLKRMDLEAAREARSRSEFIREAVRGYLDRKARWNSLFSLGDQATRRGKIIPGDVESAIREARRA